MKILILGAGEVGAHLARVLASRAEIILIDRNQHALNSVEEALDVLSVCGDITHRKVLQAAGAAQAALVVAVTGSDDANLIGAALAAEVGAKRSVARVDDASFYQTGSAVENGVLGIHAVLCAARLVGDELLRLIAEESADSVDAFGRNALQVATVSVKEFHPVCGKLTSSVQVEKGCEISLIFRDGRALTPVEATRLEMGDVVAITGEPVRLAASCRYLTGTGRKRAMIVGGGDVGMQLASTLASFEGRVQLVEKDIRRAEFLAERLSSVNIIRGDGSSIATLQDEHVRSVDYILALTRSDEVNLMVSLVARDLGVPSTYALVHRPGYDEIYRHLGVHGTTGPHDVLTAAVERLLPQAKLQGGVALPHSNLECLEFAVPRKLTKEMPLSRLSLPPGTHLLGRVEDGKGVLGSSRPLNCEQTLIVAAPPHLFRETEQFLSRLGGSS